MATTLAAAGAAIVTNKANYANMGLASAAEAEAVGKFLTVAGRVPNLSVQLLKLTNDVNLTENRPA